MTTTTTKAEINTTEDARAGLTKDLLKTMRKANRIIFLAYPNKDRADETENETTFIMRLIRESETTVDGQRVSVEFMHDVTLDGAFDHRTYYHEDRKTWRYGAAHLYLYEKGIRGNDDIHTWLSFLRPGDILTPTFYPDAHMNDYMRAATTKDGLREGERLHCDTFRAHVKRNPKTRTIGHGEHAYELTDYDTFSFLLALSICPDNSARMCREY